MEDLAPAKFILISSCRDASAAPWSAAIGRGLEHWGGGYFNVNRTLKKSFQEAVLRQAL